MEYAKNCLMWDNAAHQAVLFRRLGAGKQAVINQLNIGMADRYKAAREKESLLDDVL